jgi:hypothetical protein
MTTATRSTRRRAATMAARYLTPEQIRAIADAQNRTTTHPTARKSAPARKAATMRATVVRSQQQDRERDEVMAEKSPTMGQMRRINRAYEAAGLREFDTIESFRKVFPTMLAASIEYRTLKG